MLGCTGVPPGCAGETYHCHAGDTNISPSLHVGSVAHAYCRRSLCTAATSFVLGHQASSTCVTLQGCAHTCQLCWRCRPMMLPASKWAPRAWSGWQGWVYLAQTDCRLEETALHIAPIAGSIARLLSDAPHRVPQQRPLNQDTSPANMVCFIVLPYCCTAHSQEDIHHDEAYIDGPSSSALPDHWRDFSEAAAAAARTNSATAAAGRRALMHQDSQVMGLTGTPAAAAAQPGGAEAGKVGVVCHGVWGSKLECWLCVDVDMVMPCSISRSAGSSYCKWHLSCFNTPINLTHG